MGIAWIMNKHPKDVWSVTAGTGPLPTVAGPGTKGQRGGSLFEALIGILLVAIMGAGLAHVTAKVLHAQRYSTTKNLAVIQLREFLQTGITNEVRVGAQTLPITLENPPNPDLTFCIKGSGGACAADTGRTFASAIPVSRELTIGDDGLFGGQVRVEH